MPTTRFPATEHKINNINTCTYPFDSTNHTLWSQKKWRHKQRKYNSMVSDYSMLNRLLAKKVDMLVVDIYSKQSKQNHNRYLFRLISTIHKHTKKVKFTGD